jgi:lactoylglutathione lyase
LKANWNLDFASEEAQAAIKAALPGLTAIGFGAFIMIADPDGNLFEVQALVPASL